MAIASRQLGAESGDEVLQRINAAAPAETMSVLSSSDAPEDLLQQAPLNEPAAYVQKQSSADEALRAVYIGSDCTLLQLPFARGEYTDVALDIVTPDGTLMPEVASWIRELGILDVDTKSQAKVSDSSRQRNLTVWFVTSEEADAQFPDVLTGDLATKLFNQASTLAVIESTSDQLQLRGLRRPGSIVCCKRKFDREVLGRIVDISE